MPRPFQPGVFDRAQAVQIALLASFAWWVHVHMVGGVLALGSDREAFARLGNDDYWLRWALAMFVIQCIGLAWPNVHVRFVTLGIGSAASGIVCGLFFMSAHNSTGPGVYTAITWLSWWAMADLIRQRRHAVSTHR